MNSKKAKQLRKDMRAMGFDPREATYVEGQAPVYMGYSVNPENGELELNPRGEMQQKVQRGVPRTLAPCGRKLYKDMKEGIRIGEMF